MQQRLTLRVTTHFFLFFIFFAAGVFFADGFFAGFLAVEDDAVAMLALQAAHWSLQAISDLTCVGFLHALLPQRVVWPEQPQLNLVLVHILFGFLLFLKSRKSVNERKEQW